MRITRLQLVRQVETTHLQARATREHHTRGLGVRPDVEFRFSSHVAHAGAATHDGYSGKPLCQGGITLQRQRDIGQRSYGNQMARRRFLSCRQQVSHGIFARERAHRCW